MYGYSLIEKKKPIYLIDTIKGVEISVLTGIKRWIWKQTGRMARRET